MQTTYRDLAEFGLLFITPDMPEFAGLAEDIRSRWPFPFGFEDGLESAAVLLNQSGKIVISLSVLWRNTSDAGSGPASYFSGLESQVEALMGHANLTPEQPNYIFPGSKRLVTENGLIGDNTDVAPRPERRSGVATWGSTGGRRYWTGSHGNIAAKEVQIDLAIFEDGVCAGPDDRGRFPGLAAELDRRAQTAGEALNVLRSGGSRGDVFDFLRPMARHAYPSPPGPPEIRLANVFAEMAIRDLVYLEDAALLAFFEQAARPRVLEFRRV